jgi:hypothetical protein
MPENRYRYFLIAGDPSTWETNQYYSPSLDNQSMDPQQEHQATDDAGPTVANNQQQQDDYDDFHNPAPAQNVASSSNTLDRDTRKWSDDIEDMYVNMEPTHQGDADRQHPYKGKDKTREISSWNGGPREKGKGPERNVTRTQDTGWQNRRNDHGGKATPRDAGPDAPTQPNRQNGTQSRINNFLRPNTPTDKMNHANV